MSGSGRADDTSRHPTLLLGPAGVGKFHTVAAQVCAKHSMIRPSVAGAGHGGRVEFLCDAACCGRAVAVR